MAKKTEMENKWKKVTGFEHSGPANIATLSVLSRTVVASQFRNNVVKYLPGINKNQAYWQLTAYLMFWTTKSSKEGKLMIGQEILATLENEFDQLVSGNYSAISFLTDYWADVLPFKISDWSYIKSKTRVVENIAWPDELDVLLHQELNKLPEEKDDPVFFISGEPKNKRKIKALVELEKAQANSFIETATRNKELLRYLIELNSYRYTRALKNVELALDVVKALPIESQGRELKILGRLFDNAQPLYKTTKNSVRIFPMYDNLLALKREVRQAITKDWIECDLRSAQLAIVAKLWSLPLVSEFLAEKQSIWAHLSEQLETELTYKLKKALKHEFLYPLCFGESKQVLKQVVTEVFEKNMGINNAFDRLFGLPIMQEIWKGRAKRIQKIYKEWGLRDAFGDWLPMKKHDKRSAISLLAQEAQSYELSLLLPVLDLAKKSSNNLAIIAWQHDGFSAVCKKNKEIWVPAMKQVVENKAKELGINTILETDSSFDDWELNPRGLTIKQLHT
ncbi:MAG: hypothetical protein COY81_02970 [Candidatus Pacebacteria bacterium CG_4_10_14_0_8_um_filter_43_12]|nr:MAG: hypothetical protein COY81_02970 [Candidatus Pacebacteria bacterium CG_4_10_14_0_8_um_filter_43_12]